MFLLIFSIFIAISLCSEFYVRRAVSEYLTHRKTLSIYTAATVAYWVLSLAIIISVIAFNATSSAYMQTAGILIFILLLNGISKFLLAVAFLSRKLAKHTKSFFTAGVIIVVLLNCTLIVLAVVSTSRLRIEKETITSPEISASLDGLRIVVFSDMHTGLLLDKYNMVDKIVRNINALNPDLVINCGDIVNYDHTELDPRVMEMLSTIKSRYGVYSVLGNHDLGIYIKDTTHLSKADNISNLSRKQRQMGWRLLFNESTTIEIGGDSITITGIDYPAELIHSSHKQLSGNTSLVSAYENINTDKFNITISHAPQIWNNILSAGIGDLTLSGHVHSLQMKLKTGKGRGLSPASLLYDRWSGLYSEDGKTLYINDGIGYAMIPVRIGVRPEITLIELRSNPNL